MNVILDIDETFVQYVGTEDWDSLPESERSKYKTGGESSSGLFLLRPHFDEFFAYLFEHVKTVSLWTWSDKDYAESVGRLIQEHNPAWKVANIWYDDDVDASIDLHGHNKDLNYIWYTKNKFNPCDTILIDDLPPNTQNPSNIKNGIQVLPFHPLGEKLSNAQRKANKIRTNIYTDMSKDETLLRVIDVLKETAKNPNFCIEGDMPNPFEKSMRVMGGRRRTRRNKKHLRTRRKSRR